MLDVLIPYPQAFNPSIIEYALAQRLQAALHVLKLASWPGDVPDIPKTLTEAGDQLDTIRRAHFSCDNALCGLFVGIVAMPPTALTCLGVSASRGGSSTSLANHASRARVQYRFLK